MLSALLITVALLIGIYLFTGSVPQMSEAEAQLRQEFLDTADAWLGCKESDGSHKPIIDIYNAHEPLAQGYQVKSMISGVPPLSAQWPSSAA